MPNVQGDKGARDRDKWNKEHTIIHARIDADVLILFLKGFVWAGFVFRVSHDVGREQQTGLCHLSPARTRWRAREDLMALPTVRCVRSGKAVRSGVCGGG